MRANLKSLLAITAALALAAIFARAEATHAQVKPGDHITMENAHKVKDLVSPGTFWKVERGMQMKIIPTTRIEWPPPYKEATEKYSGQVRLSEDRRSLVGYVAGQPFPLLDPNDPDVATKIMWNNVFRPMMSDDYDLRFYDAYSHYTRPGQKPGTAQEYFQIGHYAGYSLIGRTEVEPLPVDPDFRRTNRVWLFALMPVLSPAEIRGAGFIRYRYLDPNKGDDIWTYGRTSRRVRRLNESIMQSSAAPGTAVHSADPDHYSGFNAKNEQYDFKLLGEKAMLACINAQNFPQVTCQSDGGASTCPESWEMRQLYVVSAQPRRGRGAQQLRETLFSEWIIYVDSEAWYPTYVDTYDLRGELFKNFIHWIAFRDRAVPDARIAIYPFKRLFIMSRAYVDVQSGLATVVYLPGRETPEREAWYINMGAVDKNFFTPVTMRNLGETL